MCRTIHALLTVVICGVQMLVRVFMTLILMIENVIRMFLQTLYNFISFLLQLISLIPICCVFFATSRLKCFMCGGGGPCPVRRGGGCDCLMSAVAIIILFFIFRATGVLDKIFYSIGYAKAAKHVVKYSPTPGTITECSRNDSLVFNATTPQLKSMITGESYSNEMTEDTQPAATNTDIETDTDTITTGNTYETMKETISNSDIETNTDNTNTGNTTETINKSSETIYNETIITSKTYEQGLEILVTAQTPDTVLTTEHRETTVEIKTTTAETTTKIAKPTLTSITTTTVQTVTTSDETASVAPAADRRMGKEKPFGNNDDQINEKTQTNTTKTDEDTIILYYDDDTQISGNNLNASKISANDNSHELEIEEEDMNSSENENIKHQVSKSKISGKVTRSSQYDKNYEKSILKGWLGTTSISYYMV